MNRLFTFIFGLRKRIGRTDAFHDDRLRANQPNESVYNFSYWRSLVD